MCIQGNYAYLWSDSENPDGNFELVAVDACLVPLILQLNQFGIKTLSSCCGHGRGIPYVVCEAGSEERLRQFGCRDIKTGGHTVTGRFPTHHGVISFTR